MKNILVVAAHPDDEALGCGGALLKARKQGHAIHTLFMTDGIGARDQISAEEQSARAAGYASAQKFLQVKSTQALNFPDNQLDSLPLLQIVKKIEETIVATKPDIILTHFNFDLNVDHQIVAKATLTASRPGSACFAPEIYGFEIPSSTELGVDKESFHANFFVDISESLDDKIALLKCYEGEMRPFPHARSMENIRALSQLRGSLVGAKYAEAFVTYRALRREL